MSILSSVLNIGGNIFSVVVLGWGIKGLAISSVVAAAFVDVCYVLKVWNCFKEMNVHREKVKLGFTYIKKSLPYALPNMAQQLVMYFAGLVVPRSSTGSAVRLPQAIRSFPEFTISTRTSIKTLPARSSIIRRNAWGKRNTASLKKECAWGYCRGYFSLRLSSSCVRYSISPCVRSFSTRRQARRRKRTRIPFRKYICRLSLSICYATCSTAFTAGSRRRNTYL